jgi:hypothetical protein
LEQIFKDATLFFSRELSADHPATNIATVIPAMDTIDEILTINALSSKYSVAIHAALSVGKKTLNCYYQKTDLSETYRIAMGMYYFFVFQMYLIRYSSQSFIPVTSSIISKMRSGRVSGLRMPNYLYERSSTGHTTVHLLPRAWRQAIGYVLYLHPSQFLKSRRRMLNRLLRTYQRARTSSTTWWLSQHLSSVTFEMSWTAISALTLSTSLMPFAGGMIVVPNILTCQEWRWIISLFLVS